MLFFHAHPIKNKADFSLQSKNKADFSQFFIATSDTLYNTHVDFMEATQDTHKHTQA